MLQWNNSHYDAYNKKKTTTKKQKQIKFHVLVKEVIATKLRWTREYDLPIAVLTSEPNIKGEL